MQTPPAMCGCVAGWMHDILPVNLNQLSLLQAFIDFVIVIYVYVAFCLQILLYVRKAV